METSLEYQHVRSLIARNIPANPIYSFLLSNVRIESVQKGIVKFRLKMEKEHMNSKDGIHGSVSAAIVDWAGGVAIASYDLRETTGASIDIHISYLSSCKVGEEIEIQGRVDRVGGSIAFTTVSLFKVVDGQCTDKIISRGSHTKYVKVP